MRVIETSIPAVLRERASLQPNDTAYTFVDYDQDWNGVADKPDVVATLSANTERCTGTPTLRVDG